MKVPGIYFESVPAVKQCFPDGAYVNEGNVKNWDGVTHVLMEDLNCKIVISEDEAYSLTIKAGFITDGGSIPKAVRNIISPWGYLTIAFLIHDILYATEHFDRDKCDWVLLCACQALGASWLRRNEIYSAVYAFGGSVWKKHTLEGIDAARKLLIIARV